VYKYASKMLKVCKWALKWRFNINTLYKIDHLKIIIFFCAKSLILSYSVLTNPLASNIWFKRTYLVPKNNLQQQSNLVGSFVYFYKSNWFSESNLILSPLFSFYMEGSFHLKKLSVYGFLNVGNKVLKIVCAKQQQM